MRSSEENQIIQLALNILERDIKTQDFLVSGPDSVRKFLRLLLASEERELFCVLFLNTQNYILAHEILFQGTLTQASVYPREIVKAGLRHNCAGVVLAHNHPSGSTTPSQADIKLTENLKDALELVEIKVLDHFIVTCSAAVSMAELGFI